jgi:hypothetical protein
MRTSRISFPFPFSALAPFATWALLACAACSGASDDTSSASTSDGGGSSTDATTATDGRGPTLLGDAQTAGDAPSGDDSTVPPGDDSGQTGDDGGGGGPDTSTGDDGGGNDAGGDDASDSGTTDANDGAVPFDCGPPVTLHPAQPSTGPYCPFSGTDGGGNVTCAFGQHCCESPVGAGPSACNADCSAMPDGGTDWQCQDSTNCGAGQVCCAFTTGPAMDPGCTWSFLHHFTGTVCAASCAAGQLQVCESPTACPAGQTCVPTKAKGADFGTCQ